MAEFSERLPIDFVALLPQGYDHAKIALLAAPEAPPGTMVIASRGQPPLIVHTDGRMWCPLPSIGQVLDTQEKG